MFTRLYLHIPFCQHKCPYCAFVSSPGSKSEISSYVNLLLKELESDATRFPSGRIDSIYFGGGTPSLLTPQQVARIVERIAQLLKAGADTEITLEANPGTVNREQLAQLYTAGINRLSFGVQSFDDRMLNVLGRIHSADQAREAISDARAAGFRNIGIDLIHGLPGQTVEMWQNDLRVALAQGTEHLSVYGLTVEEGTPFAERFDDHHNLPDSDLSADMFETADDMLRSAGYEHYEIANFALPGFRSRHNSGYWRRDGYLGLGLGAHSFIRQEEFGVRFGNPSDPELYAAEIESGKISRCQVTTLSREDAVSEFMFLGLRMSDGVSFSEFRQQFGESLQTLFSPALEKLSAAGLISQDRERLRLTRKGMLLSNQVFSMFLT